MRKDESDMEKEMKNDEKERKIKTAEGSNVTTTDMANQLAGNAGNQSDLNLSFATLTIQDVLKIINTKSSDAGGNFPEDVKIDTQQFIQALNGIVQQAKVQNVRPEGETNAIVTTDTLNGIDQRTTTVNTYSKQNVPNDVPLLRDIDVPIKLDNEIKDVKVTIDNSKGLKFGEGLTGIQNIYRNMVEVDRLKGLRSVTEPAPIIVQKVHSAHNFEDTVLCNPTDLTMFYDESRKLYSYGVSYVTHGLNDSFLAERGLQEHNGKFYLPELQYTADTINLQNRSSYIAGNLQFMATIGIYNDFMRSGLAMTSVQIASFRAPYNDQISNNVINLSSPTLYKSVYNRYDLAPWIDAMVAEQMDQVNYRLGKIHQTERNQIVTAYIFALDNVDQFTASLLNYNANLYLSNANNMEHLINRLNTYLLEGSTLQWDHSTDEIQSYILPDKDERLQYFLMTFCLIPRAYSQIYTYHINAMNIFLSPLPVNELSLFSSVESSTAAMKEIHGDFELKRSSIQGIADFTRLALMEIFPPTHHLTVVSSCLLQTRKVGAIISSFTVLSLYSLYFPGTFMRTIGLVQNWLVDMLSAFTAGAKEKKEFFSDGKMLQVGYRKLKGGLENEFEFRNGLRWEQEFYNDGWLPMLHGLVYFPTVFPRNPGPLMNVIRQLFEPCGVWIEDSANAIASHPRIVTRHYIPYSVSYNPSGSPLMDAVSVRKNLLNKLYTDKNFGLSDASTSATTTSSLKSTITKIMYEHTVEFNYCLHAHVSHWLKVVANTGMAVLKNFPENVFESPYSNYALCGIGMTSPLTVDSSSYETSVLDKIDFNAILSILISFRTPVIKQMNGNDELGEEMLRRHGPSGGTPFRYQNFPQSYLPIFYDDENFYQSMEMFMYFRGIIDLMTLNRLTLQGYNALIFDLEDNHLINTLRVVNSDQYTKYFVKHLLMYGFTFEDLYELDADTTGVLFEQYMENDNYPKIFRLTNTITDDFKQYLINSDLIFFLYTETHDFTNIFEEEYNIEYDESRYDVSNLINGIYPELDLSELVDPDHHTANIIGKTWKQMLNALAKGVKLDPTVFNRLTNFSTSISTRIDLGAKTIRRVVAGSVMPFDPTVDPIGIKNYLFGLNEHHVARLRLASNVIRHEMLPQIQTGIIVVSTKIQKCLFYQTFNTAGTVNHNFDPEMFTYAIGPDNQKFMKIILGGEAVVWDDLPKRVMITITVNQLFTLVQQNRSFLKEGILAGKLALRISDYKYTFEVVSSASNTSDWQTLIPDQYSFGLVGHLKLFDTTSNPLVSSSLGVNSSYYAKYVYPIEDLRTSYPVLGLESSPTMREFSKIELDHLYDTGVPPSADVSYVVNRFTSDTNVNERAEEKTTSYSRLSTTNYVKILRAAALSNKPLSYTIVEPMYSLTD